jgi:serine/threonine protein phosphatase PrpC
LCSDRLTLFSPSGTKQHLLDNLRKTPSTPVPDLLNNTFHLVDTKLSELAASENTHSGCTAAVVFLRLEEEDGTAVGDAGGVSERAGVEVKEGPPLGSAEGALKAAKEGGTQQVGDETVDGLSSLKATSQGSPAPSSSSSTATPKDVKSKIKSMLTGSSRSSEFTGDVSSLPLPSSLLSSGAVEGVKTPDVEISGPAEVKKAAKKTLYTANVGDARAVLACVFHPSYFLLLLPDFILPFRLLLFLCTPLPSVPRHPPCPATWSFLFLLPLFLLPLFDIHCSLNPQTVEVVALSVSPTTTKAPMRRKRRGSATPEGSC